MSRAFDPQGNEYYLEEVQHYCLTQLDLFVRRLFSWPMDRIADQPYGHTIHCSIIEDWNKENRQTECIEFHRAWLSNLDNIERAIKRDWSKE